MSQTKKWTVKDVITTVLLSVLLILIQLVVNMVCMVNDFVSMVLSVGFTMLLCAPILSPSWSAVYVNGVFPSFT